MKRRLIAKYVLEGVIMQLSNCVKYGIRCRNPPALTTGILHTLGLSNYEIRSFWRSIKKRIERGEASLTLLKYHDVEFKIELEFKSGGACYIDHETYIDVHDCSLYGDNAKMLTNINKIYLFIKGYVSGEMFIKFNVIYLLKKLTDIGEVDTANALLGIARDFIEGVVSEKKLQAVSYVLRSLLKFSKELGELMVYIPKNLNEVFAYIPVLRCFYRQIVLQVKTASP